MIAVRAEVEKSLKSAVLKHNFYSLNSYMPYITSNILSDKIFLHIYLQI